MFVPNSDNGGEMSGVKSMVVCCALLTLGCGQTDGQPASGSVSTVTVTVAGPAPAADPTQTPPRGAGDGASFAPPSVDEGPGEPGAVPSPTATYLTGPSRTLGKADFLISEGWVEKEVAIPRQDSPVQGLTQDLDNSDYNCEASTLSTATPLELRLGDRTGTIAFTVAQALNSATTKTPLDVRLLADNRNVGTAQVAFTDKKTLSTRVDGVSSITLTVSIPAGAAACSTTAVVTNVVFSTE